MKNQAIRYHQLGSPFEVLALEDLPMPTPSKGEVLIEMIASTIHPSDFGLINGSYGKLRDLPATGGREGVGKVVEAGPEVDGAILGKLVSMPEHQGVWQSYAVAEVEDLILLPSLVPVEQLAVAILNPVTAWRILHDFEYLREGDFIVQNAGNSAVGQAVVQFARMLGISCISLVRSDQNLKELKNLGAENVLLDDESVPKQVLDLTNGKKCVMALNSVGGKSALRLAKTLCPGGIHLTFGAMDGTPIRFPTRELIFGDVRFLGFWLDRWKQNQSRAGLRNAIEQVLQPLALDQVRYSIDQTFQFEEFHKALARNQESRMGKVLIAPDTSKLGLD